MDRHLFELHYQEKFINDEKNFYRQYLRKYPIYSLEGRLKWDVNKERYTNPETQTAWEWWCGGINCGI